MCCAGESYKGDIVVMDLSWHRLCVGMICMCSELGKVAISKAG